MYKVIFLPDAEDSFRGLDKNIRKSIKKEVRKCL